MIGPGDILVGIFAVGVVAYIIISVMPEVQVKRPVPPCPVCKFPLEDPAPSTSDTCPCCGTHFEYGEAVSLGK